jgi:hypothetical protein
MLTKLIIEYYVYWVNDAEDMLHSNFVQYLLVLGYMMFDILYA